MDAQAIEALRSLEAMGFSGGIVATVLGIMFAVDKILKWRQLLGRRKQAPQATPSHPDCIHAHATMAESMAVLANSMGDLAREVSSMREGMRDVKDELRELARDVRAGS